MAILSRLGDFLEIPLFTTIFTTPFLQLQLAKEWPTAQDCRFNLMQYLNYWILFSIVLLFCHFTWVRLLLQILEENSLWKVGHSLIHLLIIKSTVFLFSQKMFQWLILSTMFQSCSFSLSICGRCKFSKALFSGKKRKTSRR